MVIPDFRKGSLKHKQTNNNSKNPKLVRKDLEGKTLYSELFSARIVLNHAIIAWQQHVCFKCKEKRKAREKKSVLLNCKEKVILVQCYLLNKQKRKRLLALVKPIKRSIHYNRQTLGWKLREMNDFLEPTAKGMKMNENIPSI